MEIQSHEFFTYSEWLFPGSHHEGFLKIGALLHFLLICLILIALATLIGYLWAALRYGPGEGFYVVARTIAGGVRDAWKMSARRTTAIGILAVQEAIRRKVLVVFGIFALVLLFGAWFLDTSNDNPARLYLSVILGATNYLMLVMALFLSTFSIPADIKNRTIYTVVTKPVRAVEIVLGRTLGFLAVATVMISVMCLFSYVFVTRGLLHSHGVDLDTVEAFEDRNGSGWTGLTTLDRRHRHPFRVYKQVDEETGAETVEGETDSNFGHRHTVARHDDGTWTVGPAEGMLEARIPDYGELRFTDRMGNPVDKQGIDVGDEWAYRKYVAGDTKSEAIWTFDGVTEGKYPNGLDIDLNIQIFRTYKGTIKKGVMGFMYLRHPDEAKRLRSPEFSFEAQEFQIDEHFISRDILIMGRDGSVMKGDLFNGVVDDEGNTLREGLVDEHGRVELVVQCRDPAQYFGMSQADVYLRSQEGSFTWNFVKGYISIWVQTMVVICFGVMFSTFLSGPVAMVATALSVILGFFGSWLGEIAEKPNLGGGPIVALMRTVMQWSVGLELERNRVNAVIQGIDQVILYMLRLMCEVLPNLASFDTSERIANGINVDMHLLSRHVTLGLIYVLVTTVIGYFFLKTREIASTD